jgi:hypothetical protein
MTKNGKEQKTRPENRVHCIPSREGRLSRDQSRIICRQRDVLNLLQWENRYPIETQNQKNV